MATDVKGWQATYDRLKDKYDEAIEIAGPKVTLPGGVVVDKNEYMDDLLKQMERIKQMVPAVAAGTNQVFTHTSVAR